jgi:MYXO-CTERM domain-containing protein
MRPLLVSMLATFLLAAPALADVAEPPPDPDAGPSRSSSGCSIAAHTTGADAAWGVGALALAGLAVGVRRRAR